MKKLLNGRFLFILAMSLVVLLILVLGALYLFNDKDAFFVKSGYVLNPLSAKSEKYYFEENTGYRQNLSSMIEFNDVDKNEVTVAKDSFLHYNDGSLSFLKNGAILDLDSIKGKNAVAFYNITDESIIDKNGNEYTIENKDKDIKLKNFIGRISDNKYVIVGSLEAKIPGNSANIVGEYFEIAYIEEGIVNIENKDVKYQVTAEGSIIYVGNIAIDLGDKKITKNGEDVMSLTAITINGNENIDVIPASKEKDKDNKDDNGGTGNTTNQNGQGTGNNQNSANTANQSGTGNIKREDTVVALKDALVGTTSVKVSFDIYNPLPDDSFTLRITDLDNGKTVNMATEVVADANILINLLTPGTKYLFTVVNERDGDKYFQKIFETKDFGISLEKTYAADNELGFKITISPDTDITNGTLTLFTYNEKTNKTEIATVGSYDANSGETVYSPRIMELTDFDEMYGTNSIVYDGLDSNTIYILKLDGVSVATGNFNDSYVRTITTMTLKQRPTLELMRPVKDISNSRVKLSLENIDDPDNAIVGYKYVIYDKTDLSRPVVTVQTKKMETVTVPIGEGEGKLEYGTDYVYKVVVEYYDNEKYIEYTITDSIDFKMGTEPMIKVVPNYSDTTYNSISAKIYLVDKDCMVSMPRCDKENTLMLYVSILDSMGNPEYLFDRPIEEEEYTIDELGNVVIDVKLNSLKENTTYVLDVKAIVSGGDENKRDYLQHTDDSDNKISTLKLVPLKAKWEDYESGYENVFRVTSKFGSDIEANTDLAKKTMKAANRVVFKLYEGQYSLEDITYAEPIDDVVYSARDYDLEELFYENGEEITEETFGFDMVKLKRRNGGNLSTYYTIAVYVYYGNAEGYSIDIIDRVVQCKVSPVLLMENVEEPYVRINEKIKKSESGLNLNLNIDETIVGYDVLVHYDTSGLISNAIYPEKLHVYVYNKDKRRVNFYIKNGNELQEVSEITATISGSDSEYYQTQIYMGYGSDYDTVDNVMRRGNEYYFGFDIDAIADGEAYPYVTGVYEPVEIENKEEAKTLMYVAKSTSDSIKYVYEINDPDYALYKESDSNQYGLYYKIGSGEETKIPLTPKSGTPNTYAGDFTITGLNNKEQYSVYYKRNGKKTGDISADVIDYYGGVDNGAYIFDGYYDPADNEYGLGFTVINNPLVDNRVMIKILGTDELVNRILSYKISFRDLKGNELDMELWKMVSCGDDENTVRCFSVKYNDLKDAGMRSTNNENTITVSMIAIYDTGLMGYDYYNDPDNHYPYVIMQNNITPTESGNYIAFTKSGNAIEKWSGGVGKGYYTYTRPSNTQLMYDAKARYSEYGYDNTPQRSRPIGISLSNLGYSSLYGIVNPKLVNTATVGGVISTFTFSSITPKIAISNLNRLINGAIVDLTLSGADITEFCENEVENANCVNTANGHYNLYVEVWNEDDEELANNVNNTVGSARPRLPYEIQYNPETLKITNETITARIEELDSGKTYHYKVYAFMNKNGKSIYTQLFDFNDSNKLERKVYHFTTKTASDIFFSYSVDYEANKNGEYGDRQLLTTVNLIAYDNQIPYNYDVAYAFCEYGDENCGYKDDMNHIIRGLRTASSITTSFTDRKDLASDTVYGTDYYMYIYAKFYYYIDKDTYETKWLVLNRSKIKTELKPLPLPSFVIERNADIIEDVNKPSGRDYVIDLMINANDSKRSLTGGVYYLQVIDLDNNSVPSGDLEIDGVTVCTNGDFSECPIDATIKDNKIRIKNLNPDTKYKVTVSGTASLNNAGETDETKIKHPDKSHTVYTTNPSGVAFGRSEDFEASANKNSFVVTFLGGSNFCTLNEDSECIIYNVQDVHCTIGLWDDDATAPATYTVDYDFTDGSKQFDLNTNTGDWSLVIDDGINNVLGQTYVVKLQFHVKNKLTDEIEFYDGFTTRAQYCDGGNCKPKNS